jgi:biopolymer transport protein ExbD
MRIRRNRHDDGTFGLNLAPLLDVIVAVIPMLLLSVAFIEINIIETPLPQVVQEQIQDQKNDPNAVTLELGYNKTGGFEFVVAKSGNRQKISVPMKDGKVSLENLRNQAVIIKKQHPEVFSVDLKPDKTVSLEEMVAAMDELRNMPKKEKVAFLDKKTGKNVETDLLFPHVVFSNLLGD